MSRVTGTEMRSRRSHSSTWRVLPSSSNFSSTRRIACCTRASGSSSMAPVGAYTSPTGKCIHSSPRCAFVRWASSARCRSVAISKRSEEHTSELQSRLHLVCRLLLEKKKNIILYTLPHFHTTFYVLPLLTGLSASLRPCLLHHLTTLVVILLLVMCLFGFDSSHLLFI